MKKTIAIIALLCMLFSPADAFAKKKKKDKKKTAVEQVATVQEAKQEPLPFTLSNPQKQLSGEWTLTRLRNKQVTTSSRAYLNFDIASGRIYGNNGCNMLNGKFKLNGTALTFSDMVTTHQTCSNQSASKNISKALSEVTNLIINDENGIEYLILRNKSNHELLRLKRHNFDFANGAWRVTEIAGNPIATQLMRVVIDTDQMTIHGDTGCNIINGIITIDSDKYHAIQFEDLVSTRNKCADINNETALLVALEEAVSARLDDKGRLKIVDNKGNVTAIFEPLKLTK